MSVYKKKWTGKSGRVQTKWMIHIKHKRHDGTIQVIRKVSPVNTKRGAETYERELRQKLLSSPCGKEKEKKKPARPPKVVPTLKTFAGDFLAYQATVNKPTELKSKRSILEHHLLPAFGHLRLDRIDVRAVDRYKVDKLAASGSESVNSTRRRPQAGLSPKTINNHLMVLSRLLKVASKWKLIDKVPEIEKLRVPKQAFDFLDFGETERFLAAAREHEPQWYPFVLVAVRTGLRVGELLALRWPDHVRLSRRQLRIEQSYTREGGLDTPKSGRAREVPLTWDALEVLTQLRRSSKGPLVFPNAEGEIGSLRSVGHFVGKVARHAGLRHVHPHMLRHTFASHAVMKGVPIRLLQEWMGHASIEMTMRYAHLAEGVGHELIDLLAPEKAAHETRSTIGAHDSGPHPETPSHIH